MNEDGLKRAAQKIIFALDVRDSHEAVRYAKMLDGLVGCFKVGLELFISEGPRVLQAIRENSSAEIFLDLKLHDIPATMRGALRSATRYGVRFITVHLDGNESLPEITPGSDGPEVLAITVLTSLAEKDLGAMGFREGLTILQLALQRAQTARQAGCAGVVCSGREVTAVKEACGGHFKVIVPGIRPAWAAVAGDDQARTATPASVIAAGADAIVVGRPIRDASDPRDAAKKIATEIERVQDVGKLRWL
ncbi:MAG: orotidine-5'-phosphate decarboxylase [Nitrospinales bacterium]